MSTLAPTKPKPPKPGQKPAPKPQASASTPADGHHVGETKSFGGHQYRLNESHRWERADKDAPSSEAAGKSQPQDDHKQRLSFVGQQLQSVDKNVAGVMRAMQQHPDVLKGGETGTTAVHPKQAAGLYGYLQKNLGKQAGGGVVKDLGNGNLGFSSTAGAIVISAPGADGKHQVHYTHKTGVVDRAMGGDTKLPAVKPPEQPAQTAPQQPQGAAIPVANAPPEETADTSPQVPANQSNGPQLAHEQDPATQHRQTAEEAHANYSNAVNAWEKDINRGADRKTLAAHKAKVSSLKGVWKERKGLHDAHTKEQAKAEKAAAKKHSPKVEAAIAKAAESLGINSYKGLTRAWQSGGKQATVEFENDDHRDLYDLGAKIRRQQTAKNFPAHQRQALADLQSSLADRLGVSPGDLHSQAIDAYQEGRKQSQGIGEGEHRKLSRKATAAAGDAPLLDSAQGGGAVPEASPEALAKRKAADDEKLKQRKLADWKNNIGLHLQEAGLSDTPEHQAMLAKHIDDGRIGERSHLESVLKTAKRLHTREMNDLGDADAPEYPHIKEAARRRLNRAEKEPRKSYEEHLAETAKDFDIEPGALHSIVDGVFAEELNYSKERESAKEFARKVTGLSAGDIHRLEDSGKDYAGTRGLDTAGREIAAQFPILGWGHGYEQGVSAQNEPDYASMVWELVKEGATPPPSKTSPEFWDKVGAFLSQQGGRGGQEWSQEELDRIDAIPFAKAGKPWRYSKKLRETVDAAAAETDRNPSDEQKAAGNYRKGKITLHGLPITIENAKGSTRKAGWKPLACHYGYINRTEGRDGDHVDVFIGPRPECEVVFVIDQCTEGGRFDEHKCLMGYPSLITARAGYLANYPAGWKVGPITAMTIPQFKAWLADGDTTKPVASQVSRYARKLKSSPDQQAIDWNEGDHPRDQDGKFTEAAAMDAAVAAHEHPILLNALEDHLEQGEGRKEIAEHREEIGESIAEPGQDDEDGAQLADLYKAHRVGWDKLLDKLGLPKDAGITKGMTLGQAREKAKAVEGEKAIDRMIVDHIESGGGEVEPRVKRFLGIKEKPQTDLLGTPYSPPKPEAKPVEPQPKEKQVPLFSTAGSPGQMNAFDDVGVPDEMVVKNGEIESEPPAAKPVADAVSPVGDTQTPNAQDLLKTHDMVVKNGEKLSGDDKLRLHFQLDQAMLDAYDPNKAVEKVGDKWSLKTVRGTSHPGMYDTRKAAVEAATRHHELTKDEHENPSRYRDLTSAEATWRLAAADKLMRNGMGEHEAFQQAQLQLNDFYKPKATPVAAPPESKAKATMGGVIDAVNKKNEPEGGWSETDRVPAADAVIARQSPKVQSAIKSAVKKTSWTKNEDGTWTDSKGGIWKKAAKGGETSPVTGAQFSGGQWMPIHGLTPKVEKKPAKGDGERVDSKLTEKPKDEENGKRDHRPMTEEQLAEKRRAHAEQERWDNLKAGPINEFMNLSDKPYRFSPSTVSNKWRNIAKELGAEKTSELAEHVLRPMLTEDHEAEIAKEAANLASGGGGAYKPMTPDEALANMRESFNFDLKNHTDMLYPKNMMKANPHAGEAEVIMRNVKLTPERLEAINVAIEKLRKGESLVATDGPKPVGELEGWAVPNAGAVSNNGEMAMHDETGLPLNEDGTVTLYHGTTAAGENAIRSTGKLKANKEPHVYLTTDRNGGAYSGEGTGYGDGTIVAVRVNPDLLELDDEFPGGRKDFRISVGKPGGSVPVARLEKPTERSGRSD